MPRNIDEGAQAKRRSDAWASATVSTVMILLAAGLKLGLAWYYLKGSFWGAVLTILSVLELATIVAIWILLKRRLKEIEGAEQDAAAQY